MLSPSLRSTALDILMLGSLELGVGSGALLLLLLLRDALGRHGTRNRVGDTTRPNLLASNSNQSRRKLLHLMR